jgi:hypothetical protein
MLLCVGCAVQKTNIRNCLTKENQKINFARKKTMNQKLIEQLRNGEIAVENKGGTLDQLNEILSIAFPDDNLECTGARTYYQILHDGSATFWAGIDETDLPAYPISAFIKDEPEFTRGELVEVRNNNEEIWNKGIYIAYIEGDKFPHHVIIEEDISFFQSGETFQSFGWQHCRKIQLTQEPQSEPQPKFTRGELVEVRISKIAQWEKRIIVEVIEGALRPYVCVHSSYEDEFNAGGKFETVKWKYCRKIQHETECDKLANKVIAATYNDSSVTDVEHDRHNKTITIKYK